MSLACLPWYYLPETEEAQDVLWSVVARHMRRRGIRNVPRRLRRGLSVQALFANPTLLLGQCCGYDLLYGFSGSLELIATPCYSALGCTGADYRSFVLVRDDCQEGSLPYLRGSIGIINGFNSHSGANALRALAAPLSQNGRFFREVKLSGGHLTSLEMLQSGQGDVMAMDCVLHALLARYRPQALDGTRVLCWSAPAPAPPMIASAAMHRDVRESIRDSLFAALDDPATEEARHALLLEGAEWVPLQSYSRILDLEASALRQGYFELHATSPAILGRRNGELETPPE